MAECPSCNAPLKGGDWTCGRCGAPVAGAGMAAAAGTYGAGGYAPDDYGSTSAPTAYGAPPATDAPVGYGGEQPRPPAAAPAGAGSSGLLKVALIVGVVAVGAIIAVWFFALRGPTTSGDEFLGTWTATTQKGIATTVIARKDDAFAVTLSGNEPSQKVTVPAHLDGADLVITMDDFSQIAGEANAERFKAALKALAGDFKMIFTSADATHLSLRIVGTAANGQDFDETIPLASEATGTS